MSWKLFICFSSNRLHERRSIGKKYSTILDLSRGKDAKNWKEREREEMRDVELIETYMLICWHAWDTYGYIQ